VRWTETASPVAFRIDRPWFLQAWFFGVISLAMLAIAYAFHRARLAKLLALERQRGRIAMDLHDAIGSGLGSIGLLAAVGSRPGTAEGRRRELSDQIASMAGDLGTSLSDIVWSLRPGSERLEAVARYLNERANALFVDDTPRRGADFPPSWPDERLSLPLRRSLILIALEALHNAARHAAASEVRLGMARDGAAWSLWVEDDGLGVEHGVAPGSGMGLDNMRRRAAEIGARVEWTAVAPRGTRVTLTFDPRFDGGT
jgi:signal transduction histidine kinase